MSVSRRREPHRGEHRTINDAGFGQIFAVLEPAQGGCGFRAVDAIGLVVSVGVIAHALQGALDIGHHRIVVSVAMHASVDVSVLVMSAAGAVVVMPARMIVVRPVVVVGMAVARGRAAVVMVMVMLGCRGQRQRQECAGDRGEQEEGLFHRVLFCAFGRAKSMCSQGIHGGVVEAASLAQVFAVLELENGGAGFTAENPIDTPMVKAHASEHALSPCDGLIVLLMVMMVVVMLRCCCQRQERH